jgi:hypothetical protein
MLLTQIPPSGQSPSKWHCTDDEEEEFPLDEPSEDLELELVEKLVFDDEEERELACEEEEESPPDVSPAVSPAVPAISPAVSPAVPAISPAVSPAVPAVSPALCPPGPLPPGV